MTAYCACGDPVADHSARGCAIPGCSCRRSPQWLRCIGQVERCLSELVVPWRGTSSDEVMARFALPNVTGYVDCVRPMVGNVYAMRGGDTIAVLDAGIDLRADSETERIADFFATLEVTMARRAAWREWVRCVANALGSAGVYLTGEMTTNDAGALYPVGNAYGVLSRTVDGAVAYLLYEEMASAPPVLEVRSTDFSAALDVARFLRGELERLG